ncbi:MAG: hypothetical protein LBS05_02320 [Tannerellaceae bacterium]|jgi:hypothetical protein|nr:hypothetical protein [Tannerellaceae bacterium]
MKKQLTCAATATLAIAVLFGGYATWNTLDPANTCAACHEISPSHATWMQSAHADVRCIDCHGTALSQGLHSLREKGAMLLSHWSGDKRHEEIRLSEEQMLDLINRCAECHRAEYAGWQASGHAATYREIFTDLEHNRMEKPYADCFRCHGMFYEGDLHTLMSLEGNPEDWYIYDERQADRPAITCLSCHEIHTPNPVSRRKAPAETADLSDKAPYTALYLRSDKMHLRSDRLIPVTMLLGDSILRTATDPGTLLCMQCHAPNSRHQAGSGDDRTTLGEHAGKSCLGCHSPHSMRTPRVYPSIHGKGGDGLSSGRTYSSRPRLP